PPVPYHIVKKGDTVYGVSRRYQVSVSSFARLNRLKEPYTISIGQKLLLPDSVKKESAFSVAKRMRVKKKTAKKQWKKTSSLAKPYKEKKKKTAFKRPSSIPKPLKRSTWHFAWPVEGKLISKYGKAGKGRHNDGINIEVSKGTPILAAENGVIVYSGNELRGFGNLLLVKHSDGWMTAYAHNDKIVVKYGQKIKRGQKIALAGNTGNVSKPQLHFEIRSGGRAVNPLKYMRKM
ncbi:MAG: M23 family metallopeptidase, partial [Alphaproteobacteria bacterium]|nr:M23 family metallopeptidase [Alphaproteobacteria bacterium]